MKDQEFPTLTDIFRVKKPIKLKLPGNCKDMGHLIAIIEGINSSNVIIQSHDYCELRHPYFQNIVTLYIKEGVLEVENK